MSWRVWRFILRAVTSTLGFAARKKEILFVLLLILPTECIKVSSHCLSAKAHHNVKPKYHHARHRETSDRSIVMDFTTIGPWFSEPSYGSGSGSLTSSDADSDNLRLLDGLEGLLKYRANELITDVS